MNYRHAFHAGNFADVMKHVLLTRILLHLARKPTPFRVIDTHAGIGLYDLAGEEAARTGEWRSGIGLMEKPFNPDVEALLAPWRAVLAAIRGRHGPSAYPGSPLVAREMLRPEDRAIFVEKHPEDHARLAARLGRAANAKALRLDGWLALGSFVPPKERRGLVLIDPPFEEAGEFSRCAGRLVRAQGRWPTGIYALWYPVKRAAEVEDLVGSLAAALAVPALRLELNVAPPDGTRLSGSGMIVVNPPWTLAGEAASLLAAWAGRFGGGASFRCEEWARERA